MGRVDLQIMRRMRVRRNNKGPEKREDHESRSLWSKRTEKGSRQPR